MSIIRVGLDVPVAQLFDYRMENADLECIGRRVVVPFGSRRAIGVIAEVAESSSVPEHLLKHAHEMREGAALGPDDLRLLKFAADYYHYPLGQVLLTSLPMRLRRIKMPRERKATETAARSGVDEIETGARPASRALTASQASAVDAISAKLGTFHPCLLYGVTGSGKTEVYLELARRVVDAGGQVLMLVPEIALTPQLEATIREKLPDASLVSLHSGLNETERMNHWLAAQAGTASIVLGTRLSVFTPLPRLGLIVVDEEHDPSFKQTEGFCYSARDLAVVRASQRGVPVVLGSATPSLETYHNATSGRYALAELPERVNARPPEIDSVALDRGSREDGVSAALRTAIGERLERHEQALVFINRRGYAPVLMCHSCAWLSGCDRCSAQLVLHLAARELRCHHCGHRERVPVACPKCGNPQLEPLGQGTQRVEQGLARDFPSARVLRIDRDSTRRKHSWSTMREQIRTGEIDILIGTQMLAKGHDFPHLALVAVLNSDAMLYSADFRAAERLYALLTQVAGRAGRREAQGQVLIQTEFPEHPLYVALRAQDYHRFAEVELEHRRTAGFPPFVHQALLRAEAPQVATALAFLEDARAAAGAPPGVQVFDPVPASMVRLAGRERAQLLVQAKARSDLHGFLRAWRKHLADSKSPSARWTLEVDPMEL